MQLKTIVCVESCKKRLCQRSIKGCLLFLTLRRLQTCRLCSSVKYLNDSMTQHLNILMLIFLYLWDKVVRGGLFVRIESCLSQQSWVWLYVVRSGQGSLSWCGDHRDLHLPPGLILRSSDVNWNLRKDERTNHFKRNCDSHLSQLLIDIENSENSGLVIRPS